MRVIRGRYVFFCCVIFAPSYLLTKHPVPQDAAMREMAYMGSSTSCGLFRTGLCSRVLRRSGTAWMSQTNIRPQMPNQRINVVSSDIRSPAQFSFNGEQRMVSGMTTSESHTILEKAGSSSRASQSHQSAHRSN